MRIGSQSLLVASVSVLALSACTERQRDIDIPPQQQFFAALHDLCGNAYRGERIVERQDNDLLEGNEELIVHFAECSEDQIFAPFHIEQPDEGGWDRSRTWIYTMHEDSLELRHDHRLEDGSEDEGNTMYGGYTEDEGSFNRQHFIFTERTGPNDEVLGWRIEVEPGVRYSYGTMSDGEWTWRVDFDLTETVEAPPAAWGHEGGYL